MHEMAMVRKAVDIVVGQAEAANAIGVHTVYLTIGEAIDVVEKYVGDLFRFCARNTVADGAEVVITRIPYMVCCNECGHVFPIDVRDRETWSCRLCSAYQNYKLISGREFCVDRIDVRLPQPDKENEDPMKTGRNE